MNPSSTLIDEIVRQVMKNLSTESVRGEVASVSNSALLGKPAVPPGVLTQKVITEEVLSKLGPSTKSVTVAKTAIITPAAQDFARERGIAISRDQPSAKVNVNNSTSGLCLIDSRSEKASGAWNDVTRRLTGWTTERFTDTSSVISRITSSIRNTQQIIVLSSEPWNVACLANRNESIRAAVACHLDDIPAIQKSLAPNVWCVATDKPFFELRNILRCLTSEASVPSVARKPLP